ncbi:MAG TPA: hypothetical protein VK509_17555 [Polyangiales bacterium]|nr:hypothetical protein [Polyangiales bacterium]
MTLPRRLRDDPSAAPWLAEHVRDAPQTLSMPAEARKRVSDALACELTRDPRWSLSLLSWPLLSWTAGVLASAAVAVLVLRQAEPFQVYGEDSGRTQLRHEPAAFGTGSPPSAAPGALASTDAEQVEHAEQIEQVEQVQQVVEPSASATPARAATRSNSVPAAKMRARSSAVGPRAAARPLTRTPPWLAEARAALATDPGRTLALIQTHRDPRAPVSPEVVELTILALDAQRSAQSERARARP